MGDCFIRVSKIIVLIYSYRAEAVILTIALFALNVLNGDMEVYLGKEMLTITNYTHAVSGDKSGSSNL